MFICTFKMNYSHSLTRPFKWTTVHEYYENFDLVWFHLDKHVYMYFKRLVLLSVTE